MNLDAYTVRKLAPKLLIAVVAVNISIYLCVAAIDITNIFGRGLNQLISAPFMEAANSKFQLDTLQGADDTLMFFGILVAVLALGILSAAGGTLLPMIGLVMLPIVLAVLAVLVTLVIRKALLVVLTIVSPVAFALWVLPGTDKYFKQWWSLFLKTLMVYPIITALFAVTNIMAVVTFDSGQITREDVVAAGEPGQAGGAGEDGFGENAINAVMGVILVFIPLFLIPFAFKFAGGIMGTVAGQLGDMQKPINRWAGRQRQDMLNNNTGRAKAGNLTRGNNRLTRGVNKTFGTALNAGAALSGAKEGMRGNKADGMSRLQRIKHRAAAAVVQKQNESRMDMEKKLGDSYSAKMSEGNDDLAAAKLVAQGRHSTMDEARASELIARDSSKYNTHSAQGRENISSALRLINEEEREWGREAMQEKAGMDYFSSPTFAAGGKRGMAAAEVAERATALATDHTTGKVDAAKETQLLNKFRKASEKRLDASGASFTEHSVAQQELRQGMLFDKNDEGYLVQSPDGSTQRAKGEKLDGLLESGAQIQLDKSSAGMDAGARRKIINDRLLDSAMEKSSAGQRSSSHDRSVASFAEHSEDKIKGMLAKEGIVVPDEGLSKVDWKSDAALKVAASDKFQFQVADLKNTREGLRYSPEISAQKNADVLKSLADPMKYVEDGGVYEVVADAQGNPVRRKTKDIDNNTYKAVRESFRAEQEHEREQYGG